jgi:hypothetical protein
MTDLRGTLRTRPSILDLGSKSPDSPRMSSPETLRNKSPQILRTKSSVIDLHKKPSAADLRSKTSPGALRVKAGVENKVRPTSMITAGTGKERSGVRVRPVSFVDDKSEGEGLGELKARARDTISRGTKLALVELKTSAATLSPGSKVTGTGSSPLRDKVEKECEFFPLVDCKSLERWLIETCSQQPSLQRCDVKHRPCRAGLRLKILDQVSPKSLRKTMLEPQPRDPVLQVTVQHHCRR